jgi:hypothetical protein
VKRDAFARLIPACLQDLERLDIKRPDEGRHDLVATFPYTDERRNALREAHFDSILLKATDGSTTWGTASFLSFEPPETISVALTGISPRLLAGQALQWALAAEEALDRVHSRRRRHAATGLSSSTEEGQDDLLLMFAETYTAMTLLKRLSLALQLAEEADVQVFSEPRALFDGAVGPLLRALRDRLEHPHRVKEVAYEEKHGVGLWPLSWDDRGHGRFGGFDDGAAAAVLPVLIGELRGIRGFKDARAESDSSVVDVVHELWHAALDWRTIAGRQWYRVLAGDIEADRVWDAVLLVHAARNVVRAVSAAEDELRRHELGSPAGRLQRALAGFKQHVPDAVVVRDVIEHFVEYRRGDGAWQKKGRVGGAVTLELRRPGRYELVVGDCVVVLDDLDAALGSLTELVGDVAEAMRR